MKTCHFLLICCTAAALATMAKAQTCPDPKTIHRKMGTYEWQTTEPGFTGRFLVPQNGKGHSYGISRFQQAIWLQLKDLPDAPGVLQCDYIGDFGEELIRFTQKDAQTTPPPHQSIDWQCTQPVHFPEVACRCSRSVLACRTP